MIKSIFRISLITAFAAILSSCSLGNFRKNETGSENISDETENISDETENIKESKNTDKEFEASNSGLENSDMGSENPEEGSENLNSGLQLLPCFEIEHVFNNSYCGNFSIKVNTKLIHADKKTSESFPDLSKALEEWNISRNEDRKKCLDEFMEISTDEGNLTDGEELYNIENSYVYRSRGVLSIGTDTDYCGGGPHGEYIKKGSMFDMSGKRLKIGDVITDMDALGEKLDRLFQEEYGDFEDEFFMKPSEYLVEYSLDQENFSDWILGNEYLTVYFNPYSLGPYSMGRQDFTLYFDENEDLFNDNILKNTVSSEIDGKNIASDEIDGKINASDETGMNNTWEYIEPFSGGCYDFDADGKREEIYTKLLYTEGNNEWIDGIEIFKGEESLTIDDSFYSEEKYLVHTKTGYYLYIFEKCDSDMTFLRCVDLKSMEAGEAQNLEEEYLGSGESEDYFSYKVKALTDPEEMHLSSRMFLFGTQSASKIYKAGTEGPESETDFFYCDNYIVKTEEDIALEDGKVIPNGTYLKAVETDDKSYVALEIIDPDLVEDTAAGDFPVYELKESDLKESDPDSESEIIQIFIEQGSIYPKVRGMDIDITEAFSGIIFAG